MTDITITGMRRIMQPKENRAGYKILAFFECTTQEFNLRGCALVRAPRGGITVWPPRISNEDPRRSITFHSEQLRKTMVRSAQEAYRALGGTDGEFPEADDAEPSSPWDDPNFSLTRERLLETIDQEESPAFKNTLLSIIS